MFRQTVDENDFTHVETWKRYCIQQTLDKNKVTILLKCAFLISKL